MAKELEEALAKVKAAEDRAAKAEADLKAAVDLAAGLEADLKVANDQSATLLAKVKAAEDRAAKAGAAPAGAGLGRPKGVFVEVVKKCDIGGLRRPGDRFTYFPAEGEKQLPSSLIAAKPVAGEALMSDGEILAGLLRLHPDNDTHWTKEGLPSMEAVEAMLGQKIQREDVRRATGGLNRQNAVEMRRFHRLDR